LTTTLVPVRVADELGAARAGIVANEPGARATSPASLAIAWNVAFMAPPTVRNRRTGDHSKRTR
jgi:hypothetical protein